MSQYEADQYSLFTTGADYNKESISVQGAYVVSDSGAPVRLEGAIPNDFILR